MANQKEIEVLKQLDAFAKPRGYRYGLNERYVKDSNVLSSLLQQGLAFYKKAHGYRYWLPTKKGRELLEAKRQEEERIRELDREYPDWRKEQQAEFEAEARLEQMAQKECERRWNWYEDPEDEEYEPSIPEEEPSEEACEQETEPPEDYDPEPIDAELEWLKHEEAKRELAYKMDSYGYAPYENSDVPAEEEYYEDGCEEW